MFAGSLKYETKLDTAGFQKGLKNITNKTQSTGTTVKGIIAGLGITKLISSAISTINQNLDAAIARVDTLNNFPRVMKNLNIATKDSEKAIKKLNDRLKGLPTSLDEGAMSVQRLTSKNGDVEKSVDLFLAMNDAILAGGAGTQIQTNALEQLTQAYSKGKPDIIEWRSLQMAMPAQLKQVATVMLGNKDALEDYLKAAEQYASDNPLSSTANDLISQLQAVKDGTGDMTTALGTGLRTGIISMEDFMDTIVELDKNGGAGLTSFAQQAKDTTAGIQTSLTNMKTAITRGLANVIDGIDKGLKKSNLGGISGVLKSVGEEAEKVLNDVAKTAQKINWAKVTSAVKGLISVVKVLLAQYVLLTATQKSMNTAKLVKNIASEVKAFLSLTKGIKTAKNAMTLFNLAVKSNPIMLAVSAITALTAGIIAFVSANKKVDEATTAMNNYKNAMKEADKSAEEALAKSNNEIGNYQRLKTELDLLVDANGKVKEGYEERAKFIVGELNNALGTEITMTDGIIENYQDIKKAVEDVIEQKRAQALLDAEEEKYNTALDQRAKLEEAYSNSLQKYNTALEYRSNALQRTQEKYKMTAEEAQKFAETGLYVDETGKRVSARHDEEWISLHRLNEEYKDAEDKLNKTKDMYISNEEVIAQYQNAMQSMAEGNYDAVLKIYEDTANYMGKTSDETYNNYQKAIDAQQIALANLTANKGKYDQETYERMKNNFETQIQLYKDEQAKYKPIADETQEQLVQSWNAGLDKQLTVLTGHKVEFKTTAKGLVQTFVDGVKEGKPMTVDEADKLAKAMSAKIAENKKQMKEATENLMWGANDGFKNRNVLNTVYSSVRKFGEGLLTTLKRTLKERSPSKATEEMGEYLIEGLGIGIDSQKKSVLKDIENFGDEVISRFDNAINLETGNINAQAKLTGSFNSAINIDNKVEANVELDGQKVGRIVTPSVMKTIKTGGGV